MEKVENFEINFKNVESQMVIMPVLDIGVTGSVADEAEDVFILNVVYKRTQLLGYVRFSLKKFKSALSLFEKSRPIDICFYEKSAKIEEIEKEKKSVIITLAYLANE
jgi:hypothetical protein